MSLRSVACTSLLVAGVLLLGSCGRDAKVATRLLEAFDPEAVEGAPSASAMEPNLRWTFSEGELGGWKAGQGVSGLRVADGKLVGQTTAAEPVLYVEAPAPMDPLDGLHAVEVVLRTSQGAKAHASTGGAAPDFGTPVKPITWSLHANLKPGGSAETVTFRVPGATNMGAAKFVMISPADAVGATFEIESVRLVSQREHRAATPSGVGWQGLGGIYRETIVSRAPETFRINADIASGAFLDLSVGTVEPGPVTFTIHAGEREIFRRTVTSPHRWERAPVELTGLSGATPLRFALEGVADFATGFWGSPVIRVRGGAAKTDGRPSKALGGAAAPQGVIVFVADTLRSDHLPFHGYQRDTAPHLTTMAGQGAVFLDNISPATWTKVSVPSLMTSLYPTTHRIRNIPDRISALAVTMAEVYRDAGYATASFPSNSFAGMMTNLHQGFEETHEQDSFERDNYRPKTARRVSDRVIEWISQKQDVPFFAYVHVLDPHSPFGPREPYAYKWASREDRERHNADWEKLNEAIQIPFRKSQRVALPSEIEAAGIDRERWLEYEMDWYDASILGMDAEIKRLQEKLAELGLDDRVAIAFVSDHGEEFLEHDRMFHSQSAYGDLANVPLMLRYPGVIPSGVKVETTVRSIDLMPTLLDLSGLKAPDDAQGQSLLPLIASAAHGADAGALGWRPAIAVTEKAADRPTDDPSDPVTALASKALVSETGEWKLVQNFAGHEALGRPEFELYRHKQDPLDLNNVAAEHPDVVAELAEELKIWLGMVTQAQLPKGEEGVGDDVPPEQMDQLRNLGYIQ